MNETQEALERIELIYGFWLIEVLFQMMLLGKLSQDETSNLLESL